MKVVKIEVCFIDKKFEYFAEVIQDRGRYFYYLDSVVIEITQYEYNMVIKNPYLYYFSTAAKLHCWISHKKKNSYWERPKKDFVNITN